jgi:nitrogen fixation NifU-like protein
VSELLELYQEVILDHNKRPRNQGHVEGANRSALGHNPLCGDKLLLTLKVEDGTIQEIRFEGSGCAISTASASMMTEAVAGKTVHDAVLMACQFQEGMTKEERSLEELSQSRPELMALAGVMAFPVRVKCATLAWHALAAALSGEETATTEE